MEAEGEGEYDHMEGEYDHMEGEYDMEGEGYMMEGEYPIEGELDEEQLRQLQELHQMHMEGEGYMMDGEGEYMMDMGEGMDDMGEGMDDLGMTEEESPEQDIRGEHLEDSHQDFSDVQDDEFGDHSEDGIDFSTNPEFAHLPPLDPWRKSRRDILKSINDIREKDSKKELHVDLLGNKAANDYAKFLLDNKPNADELKRVFEKN